MKSKKYNKGLSILPNNRSAKGGFIVDGYLRQRMNLANSKEFAKHLPDQTRGACPSLPRSTGNQDLKEFRDNKDNYRVTKLSPELEFQVWILFVNLEKKLKTTKPALALLKTAVDFYITSPYRGTKDVTVVEVRDLSDRDNYKRLSDKHRRDVENTFDKFAPLW